MDWINIKAEWNLSANAAEWNVLLELLDTCDLEVVIEGDTPAPPQPTPTPLAVASVAPGDVIITVTSDDQWRRLSAALNAPELTVDTASYPRPSRVMDPGARFSSRESRASP